ncbi:MAG: polynucleotide adenylyltransferase PcnB [Spirochaetaceae bacterium]|nr:polynucleotide adenylyltransferase PcnB [Spirochaetaceae bacterium]
MLTRYRRTEDGRVAAKALVYTQAEHRIDRSGIDPDALRIVGRLHEAGHEAYIVGGAVRDLLLGRRPKDFDIVTDAQPSVIRRVFRSARVIGRRFRLVHVYAGPKIFEVSTFRSIANGTVGNEYGTIDEDARRRDFTLNALYFDPFESLVIDYVGGFKDIAAKKVKPVIPLATIFKEDPVRMIRCLKYASITGFTIPLSLRLALRRDASLLAEASTSRLTEEFVKILGSGVSNPVLGSLSRYKLLRHMLPQAAELCAEDKNFCAAHYQGLSELDAYASDPAVEKRLSILLGFYLRPFLESVPGRIADTTDAYREALREARQFLAPLNPPRVELEAAVLVVFKRRGISPLQKPNRQGAPDHRSREDAALGGDGKRDTRSSEAGTGAADTVAPRKRRKRRRSGSKTGPYEASDSSIEAGAGGDAKLKADSESPTAPSPRRRRGRRGSGSTPSKAPDGA